MTKACFLLAALLLALASCLARSVLQAAPSPLRLERLADGVFVAFGSMALMTRENEGAIANLGTAMKQHAYAAQVDYGY